MSLFENTPEQIKLKSGIAEFRGCSMDKMLSFPSLQIKSVSQVETFKGHSLYPLFFDASVGSLIYGRLLIPITAPNGFYVSYVSYDTIAQIDAKMGKEKRPSYIAPKGAGKESLVYVPQDSWDNVVSSSTIYVVDGVWDSITLNYLGFPAMALLGSSLTTGIIQILNMYKSIILVQDNDHAGVSLFIDLSRRFKHVSRVVIPASISKDIDEYHNIEGDANTRLLIEKGRFYGRS